MSSGKAKISSKQASKYPQSKGFGQFIYDSDEGTFFGRTPGSWFKITVFYIIFYACLAGFFCLNYYIFSRTLEEDRPKWTLDQSLIGTTPGIGFRPMPDQDVTPESTLIWYQASNERDAQYWYSQLKDVVDKSYVPEGTPGVKKCSLGDGATPTESCIVELDNLGPCGSAPFGFRDGKPCVLIKLNKIYGWTPEPFGVRDDGKYDRDLLEKELAETVEHKDMPDSLKRFIQEEVTRHPGQEENVLKTVWVSCAGENVGDKESLPSGHISYYPKKGIPGYFFPYVNQKHYKSPFVMVHFDIPTSSRHSLINIECRAWAKNINYDRTFRIGSTHFELMVD